MLVGACLGAVACSGSGGSAGPATLPPITATPSATPTAVAVPTEATAATPEAAAAFARYWFDILNQAARSGDTSRLRLLSDPACSTCERFAASIESLYRPGGRIEGGLFTIASAEAAGLETGATSTRVLVIYDVTPTRQISGSGAVMQETGALRGQTGDLTLTRAPNGWILKEFS